MGCVPTSKNPKTIESSGQKTQTRPQKIVPKNPSGQPVIQGPNKIDKGDSVKVSTDYSDSYNSKSTGSFQNLNQILAERTRTISIKDSVLGKKKEMIANVDLYNKFDKNFKNQLAMKEPNQKQELRKPGSLQIKNTLNTKSLRRYSSNFSPIDQNPEEA